MQSIEPQILVYKEGCFYKRHSDNCSEVLNPKKETTEFKPVAVQRVITTVLFLSSTYNSENQNDSEFKFDGGELQFDYLYTSDLKKLKISPLEGDFVSFLSNPYFSHSVKKVKLGTRISVVQWHNAIIH